MSDTVIEVRPIVTELVIGEGIGQKTVEVVDRTVELLTIGVQGPTGAVGPQGPQGLQGPQGDGDRHYTHVQNLALTTWTVVHNLNKYPSVTVIDSGGNEVEGHVDHIDPNSFTISFSAAFGGSAYCN